MKDTLQKEAIKKMKDLVASATICMFSTSVLQWPLHTKPLSTQLVDEEGNIWFLMDTYLSDSDSIAADPIVQLFYSNAGKSLFLSIFGIAGISRDTNIMKALYQRLDLSLPEEEILHPQDVKLIKIVPEEAYYWNNDLNDMVSFFHPDESGPDRQGRRLCA